MQQNNSARATCRDDEDEKIQEQRTVCPQDIKRIATHVLESHEGIAAFATHNSSLMDKNQSHKIENQLTAGLLSHSPWLV